MATSGAVNAPCVDFTACMPIHRGCNLDVPAGESSVPCMHILMIYSSDIVSADHPVPALPYKAMHIACMVSDLSSAAS